MYIIYDILLILKLCFVLYVFESLVWNCVLYLDIKKEFENGI